MDHGAQTCSQTLIDFNEHEDRNNANSLILPTANSTTSSPHVLEPDDKETQVSSTATPKSADVPSLVRVQLERRAVLMKAMEETATSPVVLRPNPVSAVTSAALAEQDSTISSEKRSELDEDVQPYCRICYLNLTDSDEPLKDTSCNCQGSLAVAHRSCIIEWCRLKQSAKCEICTADFADIKPEEVMAPSCIVPPAVARRRAMSEAQLVAYRQQQQDSGQQGECLCLIVFLLLLGFGTALYLCVTTGRAVARQGHLEGASNGETKMLFGISLAIMAFTTGIIVVTMIVTIRESCAARRLVVNSASTNPQMRMMAPPRRWIRPLVIVYRR